VQRRALAILLAASAAWLAIASTRDAIRAPDGGIDRAARRFAGIDGLTAAADAVPRSSADRYLVVTPAGGGKVRPGIAEMYVGKALLPAARTTDPAAATLRVRVSDSGTIAVERIR
jgi:hypothetical protein